jgi:hypothetical protein
VVSKKGLLELRFRPSDTFCHPAFGDVRGSSNLLLKVTKKRRTEELGTPAFEAKVVGKITKTVKFQGIGLLISFSPTRIFFCFLSPSNSTLTCI